MDSESAGVYMMSPLLVESLPGDGERIAPFEVIHARTITRRQPMLVLSRPLRILLMYPEITGGVGRRLCFADTMGYEYCVEC